MPGAVRRGILGKTPRPGREEGCATACFVYLLRCGDGSLYTGSTTDLSRRLAAHRSGRGAKYTRSRLPVELVYWEEAPDWSAALRREAAIKRLSRQKKLALIAAAGQPGPLTT